MPTAIKRIFSSRVKASASILLAVLSLVWIIYDWSSEGLLAARAHALVAAGLYLVITETCFIVGAIIMAATLGVGVATEGHRFKRWYRHIRYVRSEAKHLALSLVENHWFAVGFWLNFFGAVGTSLILIGVVTADAPFAGWGLLVLLVLDLAATFGWRIPLHMKRRAHLRSTKITVRQAKLEDIDRYLELQATRWNEDNMATREQLESRFKAYPQGMLVAMQGKEIVGMVYAMRITKYDYEALPSWDDITNKGFCDNADPNGAAIFGVDLTTAVGVGHLAGDELLLGIGRLVIRSGLKEALLGGRMPGYHEYAPKMTAEDYFHAKNEAGEPLDHQIKYYTSIPGLKAIKVLPDYFNDPESLDYGVLLRWRNPLFGLPAPRFWGAIFPMLFRLEELYLKLAR
jgi:hypothetical protein